MGNYNSFVFEGHGKSEKDSSFDSGAVNGSVTEHSLVEKIVAETKKNLDRTSLAIHYDEQNFKDIDTTGNSYTTKSGISVHINSGIGASGVECFVPLGEKYLSSDVKLIDKISKQLNIPNRGIKSRDYNTGNTILRKDGVISSGTDYYGEIRNAWKQGISLTILEIGFIQKDLLKIQTNIDKIGLFVAEYIAELNKVTIPPVETKRIYRVMADGMPLGSYADFDNVAKQVKIACEKGAKEIDITLV